MKTNRSSQTAFLASATIAIALLGLNAASAFANPSFPPFHTHLNLTPPSGSLTPNASGVVTFIFTRSPAGTSLAGSIQVKNLPAQGSQRVYQAWFVNTVTGDKVSLGALVEDGTHSTLFLTPGSGKVSFDAAKFTSGPDAGRSITIAPAGHNLFVVLVENIGPAGITPLSTAVSATF